MRWTEQQADADEPLAEALRLQQAAAKLGFDWPALAPLWNKLDEEREEFQQAVESGDPRQIEDELGDLLFMLVNFSRFLDVSAEDALTRVNRKFIRRLQHVERRLAESGLHWREVDLTQMEAWWQEAKRQPPAAAK